MRYVLAMEGGYAVLHPTVPEREAIAFASQGMLSILNDTIIGHVSTDGKGINGLQ